MDTWGCHLTSTCEPWQTLRELQWESGVGKWSCLCGCYTVNYITCTYDIIFQIKYFNEILGGSYSSRTYRNAWFRVPSEPVWPESLTLDLWSFQWVPSHLPGSPVASRIRSTLCLQVVPVSQADVLCWHLLHLCPPVPRPSWDNHPLRHLESVWELGSVRRPDRSHSLGLPDLWVGEVMLIHPNLWRVSYPSIVPTSAALPPPPVCDLQDVCLLASLLSTWRRA